MKVFVVLACLPASCLAKKPRPCASPPLMSGEFILSTQNENFWIYSRYLYDALDQRTRVLDFATIDNKTVTTDVLILNKEGVIYEINDRRKTCKKIPLKEDFEPIAVSSDASLLGQFFLGSSSGAREGLLVNTWIGELSTGGAYLNTVTALGCIPVSLVTQTEQYGWIMVNYFNTIKGIPDPGLLNPPYFCKDASVKTEAELKDYLSLFFR
ncbi:ependymin-2-like isoform X2 [Cheilinus undulatus]|uniref:ependymin-2-like isoform X2 n=1 Tax=Cheilinus undulatus TaxID=241271 RepID=UPI001BD38945|nr:ependymin-2-like isoform X2 [Cheilinus undulatus]